MRRGGITRAASHSARVNSTIVLGLPATQLMTNGMSASASRTATGLVASNTSPERREAAIGRYVGPSDRVATIREPM